MKISKNRIRICLILVVSLAMTIHAHALLSPPPTRKPGLSDIDLITLREGTSAVRHVKTPNYEGYTLERIDEPAPLTSEDIKYAERILHDYLFDPYWKSDTMVVKAGIPDMAYIRSNYSQYLRQYANLSTKDDAILQIFFVVREGHNESDFDRIFGIYGDGTGQSGWLAIVNLTKRKIESIWFY